MRMRFLFGVLVSLIAGTIAAQSKPDFSGRWVLVNPGDSALKIAHELVVRESFEAPLTVLTVERRSKTGVSFDSYKIGIVGGTTSGIAANGQATGPHGQITRTRFSVTWDGDSLVIETGSYSGPTRESGPYSEHTEVWLVDTQGRLVMTVTDRSTGTELRTTQLTYRRP